jgi:hypothetical protein
MRKALITLLLAISCLTFAQKQTILQLSEKAALGTKERYALSDSQFVQLKELYFKVITNKVKLREAEAVRRKDSLEFEGNLQRIFTPEQYKFRIDEFKWVKDSTFNADMPIWKKVELDKSKYFKNEKH